MIKDERKRNVGLEDAHDVLKSSLRAKCFRCKGACGKESVRYI
jgi:hypothetical protein